MHSAQIRKNDQVKVLTGRDKGKQGRVLKVLIDDRRALVENVNKVKRATKAIPQKGIKGGFVEREASIHLSNLAVLCPECGKTTRVGHRTDGNRKVRVCKKCKAVLDRKASD